MFKFTKKDTPEAGLTILADEQLLQATGGSGCDSSSYMKEDHDADDKMWWHKKHHHHRHKYWDSKTKKWMWKSY